MRRSVYTLFLGALGVLTSYFVMLSPEKEKIVTILQSYALTRTSTDTVLPYTVESEVIETILSEPKVEVVDPGVYPDGGVSWLIGLTNEGTPEVQRETFELTYNAAGELLSRIQVPYSTEIQPSTPKTYSYGATVAKDTYFTSRKATSYGVDCVGCGGEDDGFAGTSAGIQTSTTSVRQSDGTWSEGITYDGYYLIATDKAIPLCTIVEISSHRWSGKGLVPGESFQALVVDRGGAVKGTVIDLFVGTESNSGVSNGKRSGVRVDIIGFAKWTKNSQGQRMCKVN